MASASVLKAEDTAGFVAVSLDDVSDDVANGTAGAGGVAVAVTTTTKSSKSKDGKTKVKKKKKDGSHKPHKEHKDTASTAAAAAPAKGDADVAASGEVAVTEAKAESTPASPTATDESPRIADREAWAAGMAMLGVDEVGLTAPDSMQRGDTSTVFDEYARDALRDLNDASHKLATLAKSAATDAVTKYFASGGGDADSHARCNGGASAAAAAPAAPSLSTLSTGLTSWFGGLAGGVSAAGAGSGPAEERTPPAARPAANIRSPSALQRLFSLSDSETILESFRCELLQTVRCEHNTFTAGLELPFPGVLCITDARACFAGDRTDQVPPFGMEHGQLARATKQRATKEAGGEPALRLECKDGSHVLLRRFGDISGLDDALALLELKLEEAAGQ